MNVCVGLAVLGQDAGGQKLPDFGGGASRRTSRAAAAASACGRAASAWTQSLASRGSRLIRSRTTAGAISSPAVRRQVIAARADAAASRLAARIRQGRRPPARAAARAATPSAPARRGGTDARQRRPRASARVRKSRCSGPCRASATAARVRSSTSLVWMPATVRSAWAFQIVVVGVEPVEIPGQVAQIDARELLHLEHRRFARCNRPAREEHSARQRGPGHRAGR